MRSRTIVIALVVVFGATACGDRAPRTVPAWKRVHVIDPSVEVPATCRKVGSASAIHGEIGRRHYNYKVALRDLLAKADKKGGNAVKIVNTLKTEQLGGPSSRIILEADVFHCEPELQTH